MRDLFPGFIGLEGSKLTKPPAYGMFVVLHARGKEENCTCLKKGMGALVKGNACLPSCILSTCSNVNRNSLARNVGVAPRGSVKSILDFVGGLV